VKAIFTPFSLIVGIVAGKLAGKGFRAIWGRISDDDAPQPKHRDIVLAQLVVALVVEGAITRLVRGMADHGLRHGWRIAMGQWPGEEDPSAG
jgi:uncharacterized protein DUF4235